MYLKVAETSGWTDNEEYSGVFDMLQEATAHAPRKSSGKGDL